MPTLATLMSLSVAGFAVVEGEPMPTIECAHLRREAYSAPDWDSLEFYANNYRLCGCPWH
jgi:hypothetical protein